MSTTELDGTSLILDPTDASATGAPATLATGTQTRIEQSRYFVKQLIGRGEVVYGVNSGGAGLWRQALACGSPRIPVRRGWLPVTLGASGTPSRVPRQSVQRG